MSTESKKVYGIDLGTTYSAISYINSDGKPEIINNSDGLQITASAVYFESADNIVVGETAKEQGKIDSDRVVDLIKREMGNDWRREFDGKEYTPEGISAMILRYLAKGAEQAGHKVEDVVITCPAYFGEKERNATRLAGEIAGMNVLQIVDEPIAAALNYGINAEEDKNVIVYDLGGGTFDVTVVHIGPSGVKVLCSDGNHQLGGADWDICLEKLIADKFMEACPAAGDPQDDPDSRYELHNQTEKVKKKLSNATETSIAVSHNGEKAKVVISRAEFEDATRHLLDETIDFTDAMIEMAKNDKGVDKIDEFLLVGGSTYMPQVMAIIKEKYEAALGVEPKVFEPNYAVSKGAAVFGENKSLQNRRDEIIEKLTGENPEKTQEEIVQEATEELIAVLETEGTYKGEDIYKKLNTEIQTVASKSYGIRVLNKAGQRVCYNLITKQSPVPCSKAQKFPVSEDNAATLPLIVYSNDSTETQEALDMCIETGNAVMELTEGLPKGSLIEVTFELTEEGKLILTAIDLTNNKNVTVAFEVKDALSQEEVERQRAEVAELQID